ncbi:uncharacterized protein AMSG_01004 [Thecamonas trahens ATCC 50062]|uniref:Uncharacterized protein n=1 Tax=Thecamonas trahens ATCC 50062 TaxID=461836 RepID=A0A0L0DLB2_THETB|nr:hypothetical protein AMSG_01004 [Thecamonas trahens ATCC 50062]KNC52178.1 hypothetical protein AMSG_01004 [Thecamonas trahens ATCC 50062]|eukprot:XP_013762181.1 hypothetical protein AMSG_01004 [Thecamonas trahens ATCC 50062]
MYSTGRDGTVSALILTTAHCDAVVDSGVASQTADGMWVLDAVATQLYDVSRQASIGLQLGHKWRLTDELTEIVAVAEDAETGDVIVAGHRGGWFAVVDLTSGAALVKFHTSSAGYQAPTVFSACTPHAESWRVAFARADGVVTELAPVSLLGRAAEVVTSRTLRPSIHGRNIGAIAVATPGGDDDALLYTFTGSIDGMVQVCRVAGDGRALEPITRLDAHDSIVRAIAVLEHSRGRLVATGGGGDGLTVWRERGIGRDRLYECVVHVHAPKAQTKSRIMALEAYELGNDGGWLGLVVAASNSRVSLARVELATGILHWRPRGFGSSAAAPTSIDVGSCPLASASDAVPGTACSLAVVGLTSGELAVFIVDRDTIDGLTLGVTIAAHATGANAVALERAPEYDDAAAGTLAWWVASGGDDHALVASLVHATVAGGSVCQVTHESQRTLRCSGAAASAITGVALAMPYAVSARGAK